MAITPVEPRALSDREMSVLRTLLSVDFHGAAQLREQVPFLQVVGTWGEGSSSFEVRAQTGCRRAEVRDGELPVVGEVHSATGEYLGDLTLWASKGYIAAIEYAWVTDTRPSILPGPESIFVTCRRSE